MPPAHKLPPAISRNRVEAATAMRSRARSAAWRSWAAAAALAALAGQMALPAAHGLELRRLGLAIVTAPAAGDDLPLRIAPLGHHAAAHDPAACPVCQSLLRAGRAGLAATACALAVAAPAAPPSEHSPAAGRAPRGGGPPPPPRGAHRPRAPPAFLLV
jgi:hypothetical protein